MKCKILNTGITYYRDCYNLQKQLHAEVKNNGIDNHIIITEHYPVITIGRSGSRKDLLVSEEFLKSKNIEIIETDRGGDITYHGPAQIVMYPIIDLKRHFKDVHKYLRYLEDIISALLKENNIEGFRIEGKTGVWTKQGKIASIGIGVSGWITFHGIALNVNCDLTPFNWINPCGFKDIKVTSMEQISDDKIDKEHIKSRLIDLFCEKFNLAYSGLDIFMLTTQGEHK